MNKERDMTSNGKEALEMKEGTNSENLQEETHHENEHEDLSNFSKEDLLRVIQNYKLTDTPAQDNNFIKDIKYHFDHLIDAERDQALQKFIEEGGIEEDFEFRKDDIAQKFEKLYDALKTKVTESFNKIEKEREKNLATKNELLEKLRQLTSSEESKNSINTLKDLQDQWKKTGPVPTAYSQNLWASYNALVEMFYNNRSIYFELKELDRKKNLEAKKELVSKAEKLVDAKDILEAVKELRNLHDEYKFIGPVPKEEQEELWNKFKVASDKIYDVRKQYYADQKNQLDENYKQKSDLVDKIETISTFNTEKIDDWKAKTAEVLAFQDEWKKIGRVPQDKTKETSRKFWAACKTFFNNKNAFFKNLESKKEENLKLKIQLCEQAESIKDSDDYKNTANALKDLQKQWESIGPVPIKKKDEVFKRFKAACDQFFVKRREQYAETEKEFVENLKKKLAIIAKIDQLSANTHSQDELKALQEEWKAIGFVPKNEVKSVSDKYNQAIEKYIGNLENLNPEDKDSLKMAMQLASLKGSPAADKKIYKKESEIHKKITHLKKEIDSYNTNIMFLSRGSKADKLREEINAKVLEAQKELKTLEGQLKMLKES